MLDLHDVEEESFWDDLPPDTPLEVDHSLRTNLPTQPSFGHPQNGQTEVAIGCGQILGRAVGLAPITGRNSLLAGNPTDILFGVNGRGGILGLIGRAPIAIVRGRGRASHA